MKKEESAAASPQLRMAVLSMNEEWRMESFTHLLHRRFRRNLFPSSDISRNLRYNFRYGEKR